MKKELYLKFLLLLALMLTGSLAANAGEIVYDFQKDGIYYRITSSTTVEVCPKLLRNTYYSDDDKSSRYLGHRYIESGYSGVVVIPDRVEYNNITYTVASIDVWSFVNGSWDIDDDDELSSEVTSITVPGSVYRLESGVFKYGTKLKKVILKEGIEMLSSNVFSNCPLLTSIDLPKSITSISGSGGYWGSNNLISNCPNLKSISVHWDTPLSIRDDVFSYTSPSNLDLYVPIGTKSSYQSVSPWNKFKKIIEKDSIIHFADEHVKSICVSNWDTNGSGELSEDEAEAVTNIGSVFRCDSSITSFDELQYFTGLTSLGSFENCVNLESIVLPETLTSIYGATFKNCSSLRYLRIPSTVTNIYFSAFENCPLDLEIASGNVNYVSENGAVYRIFENSTYRYLMYVNNSCTSFSVKPYVSDIYEKAFWNATNLEYVTFEGFSGSTYQNYVSIGPLNGSGGNSYNTFKNCPLKEVVLNGPIKRTIWDSIYDDYYVFQNNETLEKVTLGSRISYLYDTMFDGCSNLSTVIAEGEITHVGVHAFRGTKWLETGAENGVKYLGNYAAAYDERSTDVAFRENTSGIAKGFFSGVEGLGRVVLPSSEIVIPNLMFYWAEADEVIIPKEITRIRYNSFGYAKMRKLVIEESENELPIESNHDDPFGAFNISSIGTVIISRPLKTSAQIGSDWSRQYSHPFGGSVIGKAIITKDLDITDWFNGCKLAFIEFPRDLTAIGNYAFMRNDGSGYYHFYEPDYTYYYDEKELKSIIIPSTVTSIGYQAFLGCYYLNSVTCLATTPPYISSSSFANRYDYITLYVPAGCKAIYEATDIWKDFHEIIELAPTQAPGDVNGDGYIAISDVTNLIDILLSGGDIPAGADVNCDGEVTIKDVTDLIDMLLTGN